MDGFKGKTSQVRSGRSKDIHSGYTEANFIPSRKAETNTEAQKGSKGVAKDRRREAGGLAGLSELFRASGVVVGQKLPRHQRSLFAPVGRKKRPASRRQNNEIKVPL